MTSFSQMARWFVGASLLAALTFGISTAQEIEVLNLEPLEVAEVVEPIAKPQQSLLNFAHAIAKADGYLNPQYLLGILWQESKAGTGTGWRVTGSKSSNPNLGLGQITLSTAKSAMKKYPHLWEYLDTKTDDELKARLILDDQFNIRVASKIGLMMGINKDAARGFVNYNKGLGGSMTVENAAEYPYAQQVAKHAARFKNVKSREIGLQLESITTAFNDKPRNTYTQRR